jgi:hypothetical protein
MMGSWRGKTANSASFRPQLKVGISEYLLEIKDLFENTGFNRGRVTTGIEERGPLSGENMWAARATLTCLQVSRHLEQEMSGK